MISIPILYPILYPIHIPITLWSFIYSYGSHGPFIDDLPMNLAIFHSYLTYYQWVVPAQLQQMNIKG